MNQNSSIPKDSPLQWRIPFALQMIPGVLLFLGLLTQDESPRWLVEKDRIDKARCVLARLRNKPQDSSSVEKELEDIVQDFKGRMKLTLWQQLKSTCESKQTFYRSSTAIILMFWQQFTGTNSTIPTFHHAAEALF